ncbi:Vitamin K-dependent gamma-carboxylase [Chitinophaga sp. CF118]|uniref:HTTM domain-containing protein n=1 Tax=Chitinophaga sp. CF118 TaxID=1884367 RepID=UPI0008E736ED|nr:HTTM domain-containing protein [Chitinophaga sp. CF118]SFE46192.1 Vitamin K-dependent gamma-carboxylase [Chitinophaga sp. CF118]
MMMETNYFVRYRSIKPLAVLRIAFGAVLFISTVRFIIKGWIHDFYVKPAFHFPFLEGLHPFGETGMYSLYALMAIAALFICIGLFYRIASVAFFLIFSYAELLDKTYYLNHYYLVTIICFLLMLVSAHRYCSIDVLRKPSLKATQVPAWMILIFKYQLCIVYICAGLSKLNTDWLFHAMPLRIWLPATSIPLFKYEWVAYAFSWAGALFDLSIAFLLLNKHTQRVGYLLVVIFHILTAVIFQIGMFPYLMMSATLIFFPGNLFLRKQESEKQLPVKTQKIFFAILGIHFFIQLLLPFRYLLYPGTLLWTEEGYRFSWRVMLMEKSGTTFFYVKDPVSGRKFQVDNSAFLTHYQERMMETQPDMMLQYAHILKRQYQQQGITNPVVTVESYVNLNGSGSHLYIDSTVNLANEKESWFAHKKWIIPYNNK